MTEFTPMLQIAVPQLGDPNFFHSVVLILQHNAEGALGLILNNPLELNLGDFARQQTWPCHQALETRPVFCGGPVDPERGWILHRNAAVAERQELLPGLYVSGTRETLMELLKSGEDNFRFFLGYAGWGSGQLEKEMKEGSWITATVEAKYVLDTDPAGTWNAVLKDMGVDPNRLALGGGFH
jgi:putative transcriptional regulator